MSKKQVSCDCGRVITASSDEELVASVQQHAHEVHNMQLTRDQVLAMAEPV